jgi:hypothetical protein
MKPALAITGTICAAIATAAAISAFSVRTHLADSQKAPSTGKGALFLPPGARSATAVVSLKDGLLTIAAEKVKLRDILDRVRETTGAKVDAPALDQLVTVHLGPQPPAQVIAALLGGFRVSYIIVGSAGSSKIQAIEVMREPSLAERPGSPQPAGNADTGVATQSEAARTKALFVGLTGGDEGVWDDVDVGTLLNPAASPPLATEASPAEAVPASSSIATSSQE